ncbi:hypothetical protein CCR75_004219 [Bremia lactucae]|uniref:Uncharacterized protein n=1 Tax=Bremia lactucae TaxID=4779 RepID=A0A976FR10_BRELC|nr:hypothetical protein CCR75_004219 [Bremia lactucae]
MVFTVCVVYTFQKIVLNPLLDPEMFDIPNDNYEDEVRSKARLCSFVWCYILRQEQLPLPHI